MYLKRTLQDILKVQIQKYHKSILLLGPRQTGKSSLLRELHPNLSINLAKQNEYRDHISDPGLLEKVVAPISDKGGVVFIDEIQRIPEMLNTIQALIDENSKIIFLMSGSSARKLRRKEVNLLPGRIFSHFLFPLTFWELKSTLVLEKCLSIGSLPEVYLMDYGPELLREYIDTYLREEIVAEALVRNITSFSRFLNLSALCSGQEINYSQIASDSEIPKETLRRYFDILVETLIVHRIIGFSKSIVSRKAVQREKFIYFDLGVRNGILGVERDKMTSEQLGFLFEQWIVNQIISYNLNFKMEWKIYYYRDDRKTEVDLILETKHGQIFALEIKWGENYRSQWIEGLLDFGLVCKAKPTLLLLYRGSRELRDKGVRIYPYKQFLSEIKKVFAVSI